MKADVWIGLACIVAVGVGCQQSNHSNKTAILSQSYLHKYGVPVSADEWENAGRDGVVTSTRKDGVTLSQTYTAGVLHGKTIYTFPYRDTVAHEEWYDRGILTRRTTFETSGLPLLGESFDTPGCSTQTSWYASGSPKSIEKYQNGLLVSGEYHAPETGEIEARVEQQSGTRLTRDLFGALVSEDLIQGGQLIQSTSFYPNGNRKAITPYANGKVEGQLKTFLMNGAPLSIQSWAQGGQQGTTVLMENGIVVAEIPYAKGEKMGTERRFNQKGELVEEITWKRDVRHGPTRYHVGNQIQTQWYEGGREVSQAAFENKYIH